MQSQQILGVNTIRFGQFVTIFQTKTLKRFENIPSQTKPNQTISSSKPSQSRPFFLVWFD